jgi:hypothetical protein
MATIGLHQCIYEKGSIGLFFKKKLQVATNDIPVILQSSFLNLLAIPHPNATFFISNISLFYTSPRFLIHIFHSSLIYMSTLWMTSKLGRKE